MRSRVLRAASGVVLCVLISAGCKTRFEGPKHEVAFLELSRATRVLVKATRSGKVLVDTGEPRKVDFAITFAQRRHDGWREVVPGPQAPAILLEFYNKEQVVGTYGVASHYLTLSGWSRETNIEEVQGLLSALGLPTQLP